MKRVLLSLLIFTLACSCVSKSKYNDLQNEYKELENELEELRSEKDNIERVLAEHNMNIAELEDKLSAFEERMELTKGTIITARDCLKDAIFWRNAGDIDMAFNCVGNAYGFLSGEVLILEDHGY